jgi:hypothetical protein
MKRRSDKAFILFVTLLGCIFIFYIGYNFGLSYARQECAAALKVRDIEKDSRSHMVVEIGRDRDEKVAEIKMLKQQGGC